MTETNRSSTVLITGAAGYLGGLLRGALQAGPYTLRLTDIKPLPLAPRAHETFVQADLADAAALRPILQGVQTVFHLGGCSAEAEWEAILSSSIAGTFNTFEAARLAGVKRIVFASSCHVHGFYRRERRIAVDEPPRPDSRYGVAKVFGEALGRLYADKHGLDVISLRIGVVRPRPPNVRALSNGLSEADFARLCLCALAAPPVHYLEVIGVSANAASFYAQTNAASIGFAPRDDVAAALTADERRALADDPTEVERSFQGGWFCGMQFDGDPSRID
jgi:uronate dehydrogenase